MARRMVEHGVRIVQVYFGMVQPWYIHGDIMAHSGCDFRLTEVHRNVLSEILV